MAFQVKCGQEHELSEKIWPTTEANPDWKGKQIGRESRHLFWRDLMESVEFLMLTDVKMAFVALPRLLLTHLISHENITEAS